MFRKKTLPTHSERLDAAEYRIVKALDTFGLIVAELEGAADQHRTLADDARRQSDELLSIAAAAQRSAADATRRANKIAELVA